VNIGDWVRRVTGKGEGLTKWHLVDSVVDGEPFLNCGRRLRKRTDSWFEAVDTAPLTRMIGQPQLCRKCQ
jgi:hypothetical protein